MVGRNEEDVCSNKEDVPVASQQNEYSGKAG